MAIGSDGAIRAPRQALHLDVGHAIPGGNAPVSTTWLGWMYSNSRRSLLYVLIGVVCVGALLRLANLNAPAHTPDERNYTRQAALVLQQGRGAFPTLLRDFELDPSTPSSPNRAGFLYILAGVMALTGHTDVMAGVWLSCAASIASLLLLARIACRFLNPVSSVFALTLYAVSPLPLMTGRRAWQDALVETLVLILLLTGGEIVSGARHWLWSLAFTLTGAVCISMKEIPAAVFFLASACVLWSLSRTRSNAKQFALFCVFWIGAVAAAFLWLTYLLGSAHLLIELPRQASAYIAVSPYSLAQESGTWIDLIRGFWMVSPFVTLCFPLGLAAVALPRLFPCDAQPDRRTAAFLAGFTVLLPAVTVLMPHHLNFRFLCPIFGPFYLIAGLGFAWAASAIMVHLSPSHRPVFVACAALTIVVCAVGDASMFQMHFVRPDLQDLSIHMLLSGSNS
jgi:hypothetical protein